MENNIMKNHIKIHFLMVLDHNVVMFVVILDYNNMMENNLMENHIFHIFVDQTVVIFDILS
jgi:hypothetical protein